MAQIIQRSFTSGEVAPGLRSRADLVKYTTGLALCENFFIKAQGGAYSRPGFRFVGEVQDSTKRARLIPFSFNVEQTYILVFEDLKMRVIRDGGFVLESTKAITAATQANPVQITATGHGYSTGDEVYISDVGGMTELNGKRYRITYVDANNFTLDGVDGTGYTAYTSGGTSARYYTLTTTYTEAELPRLVFTQDADVMTITHPSHDPANLSRLAHDNWTLTTINFASSVTAPGTLTLAAVGTGAGSYNKSYRYVVTTVDANGVESLASPSNVITTASLSTTAGVKITWSNVSGADYYRVYKEVSSDATTDTGIYGWLGDTATELFTDFNLAPITSDAPPEDRQPFTGADNKPATTGYYQQRQLFGNTNNEPQVVYTTQTAVYNSLRTSRPSRDDDAVTFTIKARQVNEIRHFIPFDSLVILTSGGEWKVTEGQDQVLTPSTAGVKPQTFNGASWVPPAIINDTAIYVQEKGSKIRDLNYEFSQDKYTGNDLSIMSDHFFENYTVEEMAFSSEPYGILWCVRDDGRLLGLTYQREHQVWGWHQHVTDGIFESVAVISEGDRDALYAVVKRTINGSDVRYVERMEVRDTSTAKDVFCVDSGLSYDGLEATISGATQANPVVVTATSHGYSNGDTVYINNVVGMTEINDEVFTVANATANTFELSGIDGTGYTAYTSGGTAKKRITTVTGLDHLEGETLAILSDGNEVADLVVSGGAVTLPRAAGVIHAGLAYTPALETLDIDVSASSETLKGKELSVSEVVIEVEKSRGGWVGPKLDVTGTGTMYEIKPRFEADGYDTIALKDFKQVVYIDPQWGKGGGIRIEQRSPLPLAILSVIPRVDVGG